MEIKFQNKYFIPRSIRLEKNNDVENVITPMYLIISFIEQPLTLALFAVGGTYSLKFAC